MVDAAVDVTVTTRFADPQTLMSAVGSWIERGCLRVPALIECGRTFQIALLTSTGETAVLGSAEGIRQDGKSTYVRFLSAANDQTDGGVWFDLADADVAMPPELSTIAKRHSSPGIDGDWVMAAGTPLPSAPTPAPTRAEALAAPMPQRPAGAARGTQMPDLSRLPKEPPGMRLMPALPRPQSKAMPALPAIEPMTPVQRPQSRAMPVMPAMPAMAKPMPQPTQPAPVIPLVPAQPQSGPVLEMIADEPPLPEPVRPSQAMPAMAQLDPAAMPPQMYPAARPSMRTPTIPPPMVAVWATGPDPTGAFHIAPAAPGWAAEQTGTGVRMRPPTLPPPGWAPDQGASGMWIPVVDPSAVLPQPPPTMQQIATPPPRASRGPMFAAVAIAGAGAVVAITAVLWARSVSRPAAPPPAKPAVAAAACAPDPAPDTKVAPAPAPAPAPTKPAPAPTKPAPAPAKPAPAPAPAKAAAAPTPTPTPAPAPAPAPAPTAKPAPMPVPPAVAAAKPAPEPPPEAPAATGDCSVKVTASATDVGLYVDGRRVGVAPTTLSLPCTATAVTFKHGGRRYVEQTKRVTPTADGGTLHATMDRPKVLLKVVSRPSGANVSMNGRDIGKTPMVRRVDGFESVTLTVKAPGMATVRRLVYPKRGTTVVATTLKKKRR